MNFQYFRFFLSPIQGNLFSQLDDSRVNSIQEVFKTDFDGKYRGVSYTVKFINQYDDIFHLKIAKHTSIKRNKSPEENFETELMEHWPYVNMLVSPLKEINNDYGQIIAVEHKANIVDNPTSLLRDWADSKNFKLQEYGYAFSINPITQKESFWNIVKKYQNQIEEVTFEYAMPNLFNTNDVLEDELKNANKNLNASKAIISFSNKAGYLNLLEENTLLKQSADYVDNGGGNFKIKRKGEKRCIISAQRIKSQRFEIDNLEIQTENANSIIKVMKNILGIE